MSSGNPVERTRPWLGITIAASVVALLVMAEVVSDSDQESEIGIVVAVVLIGMISGLLVAKRPGHPISWLMTAAALCGLLAGISAELLPPGLTEITWWQAILGILSGPSWYGLLFTVLVLIPLLFPTGAPPSVRWRWVGWTSGGALVLMSALWMLQEGFCTDVSEDGRCLASVSNPIGIRGIVNAEQSFIGGLFYMVLLACSLGALGSLVVRFRRAGTVERQQIKWVFFSISLFVMFTVLVDTIWLDALGGFEPSGYWLVQQVLWVLIPLSVALAILRYRLYEIDRIISRTVSYASVISLLGLLVLGMVTLFAMFVPSDDPLVVAVATLAAAAAFNPLRHRIQTWVDRRFNRSRYDAERVMTEFSGSLRDLVAPDSVVGGWVDVVAETMQPSVVGVWVRDSSDPGSS